jgi:hypothetical protein
MRKFDTSAQAHPKGHEARVVVACRVNDRTILINRQLEISANQPRRRRVRVLEINGSEKTDVMEDLHFAVFNCSGVRHKKLISFYYPDIQTAPRRVVIMCV